MKKIDKFIMDIDEETHSNKKENSYYSNELNRLEHQLKRTYGRYRKETIAGDQDIEDLKKLAQEYSSINPGRGSGKQLDEDPPSRDED
jgi:hypothetical protein